jgi:radial spoke head protein 9
VYGITSTMASPSKKWFYATTKRLSLEQMPDLTPAFEAAAAAIGGRFLGNPAKLLGPDADAPEEEDAVDDAGNPKPKTVRFSEGHRLAAVVRRIDADTGLVPRGAFAVTPTHHVAPNVLFAGLSATEATSLASYYHFRPAAHPSRAHALHKAGVVPATDFLDPASEDGPAPVWTVRLDAGKGLVELRSLKWPGYHFLHAVGTSKYGGVYAGDGLENVDLPFMV